jgi:uncharacterized protein YbaR (Trm112 family)
MLDTVAFLYLPTGVRMPLPPDLLPLLVCPACRTSLRPVDNEPGLACDACAVVFPVEQDIPLLLTEEAVPLPDWERRDAGAVMLACNPINPNPSGGHAARQGVRHGNQGNPR